MILPFWRQDGWTSPTGINYLHLGLGFLVMEQAFEFYLNFRQRKYLKLDELPKDLVVEVQRLDETEHVVKEKPPVSQEMERDLPQAEPTSFLAQLKAKFVKSRNYNLDKNSFSFVSIAYSTIVSAGMLLSGLQVLLWDTSTYLATNTFGMDSSSEISISMVYLVLGSIVGTITQLPVSIYQNFVVEQRHGFNKMTWQLYVSDLFKGFLVENCLTLPLMAIIIKVIRWSGSEFWIKVWLVVLSFSILMLTIYPNYIMPLFNEYKPLPNGELKTSIENLAASLKFPLTKIFEVDGSKRSSHSNAYLFGFFKDKRIVLYDTLIKNEEEPALSCSTEEIVGILAHELGHWKRSHTLKSFVVQNAIILGALRGFALFLNDPNMYASFGFHDNAVVIGLNLFGYIMAPFGSVLGLLSNMMVRSFEFEADAFAATLGHVKQLKSGLVKISIANLSSVHLDPWYQAFHHSHPSLLERLRAMDAVHVGKQKKLD